MMVEFFLSRHVTRVAKYVKSKRPQIKLFIWHDMISQLLNSGYNNVRNIYLYIYHSSTYTLMLLTGDRIN